MEFNCIMKLDLLVTEKLRPLVKVVRNAEETDDVSTEAQKLKFWYTNYYFQCVLIITDNGNTSLA